MLAAARLGLDVPRDVSIVGYDDDEIVAAHLVPALTTVRLPHHEIGAVAMRALVANLEQGTPLPVSDRLLPCEPVDRDSVTAP